MCARRTSTLYSQHTDYPRQTHRDDIDRPMISRRRDIGALSHGFAKPIVLFTALLILIAQLFALGHFHQRKSILQFNAQTQIDAADGLCALCFLALHAPANPPVSLMIERPRAEIRLADVAIDQIQASISYSSCRTRAPPPSPV
jgi:hypothetical protein